MPWAGSLKRKRRIQTEKFFELKKYSFVIDRICHYRHVQLYFICRFFTLKGIACFSAGRRDVLTVVRSDRGADRPAYFTLKYAGGIH